MENILRQIRNDLRLSMSGEVSYSLRNKGIDNKIIFGVNTPDIKKISEKYESDKTLAETLWREDVREMKIMATLLYPKESFTFETAIKWTEEINNQELREQSCKNLFQELTFADQLVENNIKSKKDSIRNTGYWLFARLCIIKSELVNNIDTKRLTDKAIADLKSNSMLLRQSALNALKFFGRISKDQSEYVLSKVSSLENSQDPIENEMYAQLKFEFESIYY